MKNQLKRQLTKQQNQAYEGAKNFYYCVLPTFIALALCIQTYYILKEVYLGSTHLIYEAALWIDTLVLDILAVITYRFAIIYYKKCNEIDTSAISNISIKDSQIEIQQSEDQQDTFLLKQKPKRHFCKKCSIVTDYRTKHCSKCQVCIQKFDHHCFWLGNCVGRYNYKPFYYFLVLQSINNYLILILMYRLSDHFIIDGYVYAFRLVGMLTALGFLCFTGFLSIYHTMLISCGITTWEHMRRESISYLKYIPIGHNPFSLGIYQNWKKFITHNELRQNTVEKEWEQCLPTYEQSKVLKPSFNLIQNEYYSCC